MNPTSAAFTQTRRDYFGILVTRVTDTTLSLDFPSNFSVCNILIKIIATVIFAVTHDQGIYIDSLMSIYRFIHTKRATAKYAQRSKKGRATRKGMDEGKSGQCSGGVFDHMCLTSFVVKFFRAPLCWKK